MVSLSSNRILYTVQLTNVLDPVQVIRFIRDEYWQILHSVLEVRPHSMCF